MINETVAVNMQGLTQLRIVLGSDGGRYAIFDMNYVTSLRPAHEFRGESGEAGDLITYIYKSCGAYDQPFVALCETAKDCRSKNFRQQTCDCREKERQLLCQIEEQSSGKDSEDYREKIETYP